MATVKSLKADISSVSPSSERFEEFLVVFVYLCRKRSYAKIILSLPGVSDQKGISP